MATIRASEIGSFLFCARAWWYQRQGIQSTNQSELASGSKLHQQHRRKVLQASLIRGMALLLLVVSLLMFVSFFTARLL